MSFQDRNWLATVALANARWILWLTGIASLLVLLATYLTPTIYQVRSVLVVDSDLSAIMRGMTVPYPAKTQGDYIRYEYFATHAVALMSETSLAAELIDELSLNSRRKKPLKPEKFINPGITDLLFSNDGLGVGVKWIADTQQFAISGYSRDPDQALKISETYARLFLQRNASQFSDTLRQMIIRADAEISELSGQLDEVERQMTELRSNSESSLPRTEVELTATRISSIIEQIESLLADERVFEERLKALSEQEQNLERLRTVETSLQANPYAQSIQEQIGTLVASQAKLSVEYTPLHPERKAIENQIKALEEKLRREVERTFGSETLRVPSALDSVVSDMVDYTVAHRTHQASLASLQATLSSERQRAAQLAAAATKMETLGEKRSALVESISEAMTSKSRFSSLLKAALPTYRLAEPPFLNKDNLKYYKHFPRRKSLLLKVILAVGMLSTFFAIGRDLYANPLYRAWQIEDALPGIPCAELNSIESPIVRESALARVWQHVSQAKLIALVSSDHTVPDDLVSFTLMDLARKAGKSCLLVDARFEESRITHSCGRMGSPGLLNLLHRTSDFDSVVYDLHSQQGKLIPRGTGVSVMDQGVATGFFERALRISSSVLVSMNCLPEESPGLFGAWPEHATILLTNSGAFSLHSMRSMSEHSSLSSIHAVVLSRVPLKENPLTLKGASTLLRHLLTPPIPRSVSVVPFAASLISRNKPPTKDSPST